MLHFSCCPWGSQGKDTEVDHWRREWQATSVSLPWEPHGDIQKQRSHFANKGLYSQSHGFSSSHVWMWELDHKEGWALKNWCFQSVVLEKTLESPLESKLIKPVNPKGNQPWIFIGRSDAGAEAPILWPLDSKNRLIGKDPDSWKYLGQEEKRAAEDEMALLIQWTWVWANCGK